MVVKKPPTPRAFHISKTGSSRGIGKVPNVDFHQKIVAHSHQPNNDSKNWRTKNRTPSTGKKNKNISQKAEISFSEQQNKMFCAEIFLYHFFFATMACFFRFESFWGKPKIGPKKWPKRPPNSPSQSSRSSGHNQTGGHPTRQLGGWGPSPTNSENTKNLHSLGGNPKIGGKPQNRWFSIMENPMNQWMIWGEKTPIFGVPSISTRWTQFHQL